jgi:hypothetical protein
MEPHGIFRKVQRSRPGAAKDRASVMVKEAPHILLFANGPRKGSGVDALPKAAQVFAQRAKHRRVTLKAIASSRPQFRTRQIPPFSFHALFSL